MPEAETFQHYQVLRKPDGALHELGRGAMGVTYKAFDTNLRCHVALKVINAAYLDSDMARQRFLREARAAAGLSHPNVASVFHLGEEGGNYFYAMEFIDGETLEAFVRRSGPLPPVLALRIALQVTRALRAAEREGLVHRDIKPANLMLLKEEDEESDAGERHVKVIDFGLAKVTRSGDANASASLTVAGFVGTPHFASPEQLEEKDLDVRSDIYSLGVTLWYMLTGRPPFAGSMVQIMSQHLTRPPAFASLAGQPPEIVHLLEHLLEKDPAKRPQTPSDLRREIEQAIAGVGARAVANPAAGLEVDAQSFLTEAATDDQGLSSDQPLTSPPPAAGVVLEGRYRLLSEVGQDAPGTLFQALELDTGRAVALNVLDPGLFPTPEALRIAQAEADAARLAPHPNLLRIIGLERLGGHTALIYEWVNGFALLDVLRHRHALPIGEALLALEPLAAAADHAGARGLRPLDLSPSQALLAFDAAIDLPARTALMDQPLGLWPEFQVKVMPVALSSASGSSATWAGQQTVAPERPSAPGAVRQLALLTCELLGGAMSAAPSPGTTQRLRPLAALTEEGNAVLNDALAPGQENTFASASDFVRALAATVGSGPVESLPPPKTAPAPATPPKLPAAAPALKPTAPATASSRRGLMIAMSVGILLLFLVGVGGVSYIAWKVISAAPGYRSTVIFKVSPALSATPAPEPSAAPVPIPTSAPASTPSRDSRFKDALAEATRLESAGDEPAALAAYVKLSEDFPDLDPGMSRVDSYITTLRAKAATPELEDRRFTGLRASMERAAGLGSELAMEYLGMHLSGAQPEEAAGWFRKAADKGLPEAMVELGNLYYKGRGVPLDAAEAARWFRMASDKGYVKATVYLAECYESGKGVPVDFDQSFALLNQAYKAEPDYAPTLEKLGLAYEKGRGTPPDPRKAFALMKRSADLGDVHALGNLGAYYITGLENGRPNESQGAEIFRQGAEKADPYCMFNYARCLEAGVGVRANRAQAIIYYRAAAEKGYGPARQWCQTNHVSVAQ